MSRIHSANLNQIKNERMREYASIYTRIEDNYLEQLRQMDVEIAPYGADDSTALREKLRQKGAIFRNNDYSVYVNAISPACVACRMGVGTATFFISLLCQRSCFFCFNPNQEDYSYYRRHRRDAAYELKQIAASGEKADSLALTGGEPLLHPAETVEFFRTAAEYFPAAHTRLYTCGDQVERSILQELNDSGLQEIRFSIRMTDNEAARRKTMENIALARDYIPSVMVEMPVLPGTLAEMRELLLELDELQIFGINLLEFCFPYRNGRRFREQGYQIKNPPHQVLYNYWYAGGVPVAGSELEALQLLDFALEQGLKMGVHYCSLENKHTGQLYRQNRRYQGNILTFSDDDYFLHSAKVFGRDISPVLELFRRRKFRNFNRNRDYDYLEFPLEILPHLKDLQVEVALSTSVLEERQDGEYLRELRVDYLD